MDGTTTADSPALEFSGVVKRYGRREALAGLDLAVPRGSVCGLVGANGAGKTTSLGIAAGLIHPSAGVVSVLGDGPFDPLRHGGRVSLLPQDTQMPGQTRARDFLVFLACLQGLAPAAAAAEANHVLARVHLADRAASPIRTLSHGMRRRLMIAQALLGEPELVLLDEPLNGLDPREVVNAREILRGCRGRQTVVISSHNLHEVELACDHVIFLERGRVVRQDSMAAVTRRQDVIRYALEGGPAPLAALRLALPDADFEAGDDTLTCRYDGRARTVAAVNAQVLQALLASGLGVVEVRRGSALEAAYLEGMGGGPPVPPPVPVSPAPPGGRA